MPQLGRMPDGMADLLRQQEVLLRFIESISSELKLRPLLTRIVHHACELIGAGYGTIGLVDEARSVVRTEAVFHMPPDELGAEMGPGVGIAGHVYQVQRPVVLERYGDVQCPTQPDLAEHAVVGMPVFWQGRMIGFFGIGAEPPRRFGERDVETLSLFARHAAVAIENARRYEREQRRIERMALMARIGRIVSADLRLYDLLQRAADAIHELMGYSNVAIALILPEDPGTLVLRTFGGFYRQIVRDEHRIPISQGIMGAAARERQIMLVNDVAADPRHIPTPGAIGITAELAVPILHGDGVLGVLNVESDAPFGVDDAESLQVIADQLAVAIENARLFARVTSSLDETKLLYETSRRINEALTVEEVISAYLAQVAVRGRYVCNIALYEHDASGRRSTVVVRGRWSPEEGVVQTVTRHRYTHDALDAPLDAGQTVTIVDVHTDPRVSGELRRIQQRSGPPALAMIPLMARGERIGLVVLSNPRVHDWPEADLQPYQTTAAQLAVAIDHRRQQGLLYQRGQQLAVLEERQRLARELHDSVTQLVFSSTLIAQSIAPAWRRDPAEGERRVDRLLELSRSALAEMRALLSELHPVQPVGADGWTVPASGPEPATAAAPARIEPPAAPVAAAGPEALAASAGLALPGAVGEAIVPGILRVQREGLPAALSRHVAGVATPELRLELDATGYRRQPLAHEEALFRIAQEALNNVVKHSRAGHVGLRLSVSRGMARLTITDDGIGFRASGHSAASGRRRARSQRGPTPESAEPLPPTPAGTHTTLSSESSGGFGLRTMQERATALEGRLRVRSAPGRGTTVTVALPNSAAPPAARARRRACLARQESTGGTP
ncbi:MAG: GAF domain-containing protein [Chloroflexota bacterium]|nr:GAF domain-containing protein [Chloroflexota bacterium]